MRHQGIATTWRLFMGNFLCVYHLFKGGTMTYIYIYIHNIYIVWSGRYISVDLVYLYSYESWQ